MKRSVAVSLLVAGAWAQAALGDQKSDDRINDQVRMRITVDADVKGGGIDVSVKDGVVTLKGRVDSERGKSRASKLTKKVKGVKDVENELVVGPAS